MIIKDRLCLSALSRDVASLARLCVTVTSFSSDAAPTRVISYSNTYTYIRRYTPNQGALINGTTRCKNNSKVYVAIWMAHSTVTRKVLILLIMKVGNRLFRDKGHAHTYKLCVHCLGYRIRIGKLRMESSFRSAPYTANNIMVQLSRVGVNSQ